MDSLEKANILLRDQGNPEQLFSVFLDKTSNEEILSSYIPFINKMLPRLLSTARKYQMTPRWNYRPDYFSYDVYETTNWWWLILYINRCSSIADFHINKLATILAPSREALRRLFYLANFS